MLDGSRIPFVIAERCSPAAAPRRPHATELLPPKRSSQLSITPLINADSRITTLIEPGGLRYDRVQGQNTIPIVATLPGVDSAAAARQLGDHRQPAQRVPTTTVAKVPARRIPITCSSTGWRARAEGPRDRGHAAHPCPSSPEAFREAGAPPRALKCMRWRTCTTPASQPSHCPPATVRATVSSPKPAVLAEMRGLVPIPVEPPDEQRHEGA